MASNSQELEDAARDVGVLKCVSDDFRTWHFQSSTHVKVFHTVDLWENNLSGACSCPHFDMRIRPLITSGLIKLHSEQSKCKHIRRAEKVFTYWMKKRLCQHLNPNPKKT